MPWSELKPMEQRLLFVIEPRNCPWPLLLTISCNRLRLRYAQSPSLSTQAQGKTRLGDEACAWHARARERTSGEPEASAMLMSSHPDYDTRAAQPKASHH